MKRQMLLVYLLIPTIFFGCEQKNKTTSPPNASSSPAPTETPIPSPPVPTDTSAPSPSAPADMSAPPAPAAPELLSEYETKIYDKKKNRTNNLVICAKALDGQLVSPGEEFSFNGTVGQRTKEKGYLKAITYDENGQKKTDYGGGICQISSTLHMAAKKAGLVITERHDHKREVPYDVIGNDAAISYGAQDFKFLNNQNHTVKIHVTINGQESVIVKLYKI